MNLDFKVTRKFVKELLEVLDGIVEEIIKESREKYLYAEWEGERDR